MISKLCRQLEDVKDMDREHRRYRGAGTPGEGQNVVLHRVFREGFKEKMNRLPLFDRSFWANGWKTNAELRTLGY